MAIKSQRDLLAGMMFTIVGAAFAFGAREYNVGSVARMGPGYYPLLLGIILAAIGLLVALQSFGQQSDEEKIGPIAWRPLIFIIGANLAFGILIGGLPSLGFPAMGLIPAIAALVVLASLASTEFSLKRALSQSAILAAGSWLVFVKLLSLPFQLWPTAITG
ncbi:tripartite tricarboxylate transporter TctB family protein [Aromatoleum toluolicum]|uniref:Tripartite tricarboxylate transporter TctB family protein n=1 Tax=Aromatoleum toluolicum TaxID=90060 RepID=A0ABX1NQ12_9RHOO|nr:tripartite tricarboxylate transporter TctB family protein [Aromatoleum toluolicum]NMG01139.1 tripartite tricarboxylate transporter TctB family protein [Aromatoleum toluolicum]